MSQDIALPVIESKGPVENAIDLSAPQRLRPDYLVPPQAIQGPLTSDSFTSVPFADLPLYIPGLTQNVVGFNGGINKAALDVHREQGLLCNLLPYLDMAKDDFIELFCRDLLVPVDIYNITQDDVDKARMIPLYIPRTRLPDGPLNPVFIRVTRVGGATAETQRLNLKVDTVPPAGRNPIGSTLHNENLPVPVFPQKIIDFGVTEEDAQAGVPVTFPFYPVDATQEPSTFRATRDRIRLRINGIEAPIPALTEHQATGREDITFTLSHGFWKLVRSGSHVCEYEIIDEVGNASLGWSPALLLNVRLNDGTEPILPEAFILEAADNILDHDRLEGRDATIFITTRSPDFALGDSIRVTVRGRADGGIITTTYDSAPLTSLSFITLALPNADLQPFITGQFQLFYERIRTGTTNRPSKSIIVDVTGTPIDRRLPPPVVLEASGGILDPQSLFVNVVVRAYPELGQAPFDLVTLLLYGTKANGDPVYKYFDKPAGTGDVLFRINNGPNGEIAGLEGGTLRLLYLVINEDGTRKSEEVTVNVGEAVASLPEPEVAEAPAPLYQFDPEKDTGDANILVRSNSDFLLNDTVTLYCVGTAPGGTAPEQPFPIRAQWLGRDLRFTLKHDYIIANLDKTMRIYYTRMRDNTLTRFSHAVNMKVGSRLELKAPTVLEATVTGSNQASLNPLHVLPPHRPVVTIRVVSDKFPAGSDIKVFIVGKPGVGMPNIPAEPATPEPGGNYVSFTVPNAFVGAYLGGKCTVYYTLIEIGKTTKSDELALHVQALPAQEWDLVSVPQAAANGGMIDTSKAHDVRIDKWPFFTQGRAARIQLHGYKAGHAEHNLTLRNNTPVSAQESSQGFVSNSIPDSYLEQLLDTSELTVKAWVSTDGLNSIPPNQELKTLHLQVLANATGKPSFTNSPYLLTPQGRVFVQLRLDDASGQPVPNGKLSLTLPNGFNYADGSGGEQDFVTDLEGKVLIDVKCNDTTGSYTLIARSGAQFDAAAVNVVANGPDGSVGVYYPRDVALNPEGTRAYVSSYGSSIHVINTTTNALINTIQLDKIPSDLVISPDGTRLYAGHTQGLSIIDLYSQQVTNVSMGGHSDGSGIAITPDGRTVCLMVTAGALAIMDTATYSINLVSLPANPSGLVITRDGRYAVVGGSELTVIDIQNKAFVKRALRPATSLAINPKTDSIYVCTYGTPQMYTYNLDRNEVTDFVKLDNTYYYNMSISHDGERLYISPGAVYRHVAVVDTVERKMLASKAGADSSEVAISPDNQRMYLTNIRSYTLTSQSAR